jgi:hypothetical protein
VFTSLTRWVVVGSCLIANGRTAQSQVASESEMGRSVGGVGRGQSVDLDLDRVKGPSLVGSGAMTSGAREVGGARVQRRRRVRRDGAGVVGWLARWIGWDRMRRGGMRRDQGGIGREDRMGKGWDGTSSRVLYSAEDCWVCSQ